MTDTSTQPARRDARRRRTWWRWLFVAAYMGTIFVLSGQSDLRLPARLSDKVLHAGGYFVLSALIVWALVEGDWRRTSGRTAAAAVAASMLYGWSDEVHQLFVPDRYYEWFDLLADATGASAAAVALWGWGIISRGSRQPDGV